MAADNDNFDDRLKEILSSEDPSRPAPSRPHTPRDSRPDDKTVAAAPRRRLPRWAEFLLRLLAGVIAGALLAYFGLHIAGR
jgi:hypothetical protein